MIGPYPPFPTSYQSDPYVPRPEGSPPSPHKPSSMNLISYVHHHLLPSPSSLPRIQELVDRGDYRRLSIDSSTDFQDAIHLLHSHERKGYPTATYLARLYRSLTELPLDPSTSPGNDIYNGAVILVQFYATYYQLRHSFFCFLIPGFVALVILLSLAIYIGVKFLP